MGATNSTANYSLSQFVGTDKPAWLQDYNGDMLKIDTGINAAKVAADNAGLAAGAAQTDATTANNAITNTITPAITSLQNTVGSQGGTINTITSLIGNGTPTTTDQTIIGAINEINAKVGDDVLTTTAQDCTGAINELAAAIGGGSVEVVSDGVKTNAQLLNELFALIDITKVNKNSVLELIGSGNVNGVFIVNAFSSTQIRVVRTFILNTTEARIAEMRISSTSKYDQALLKLDGSASSYSDFASAVEGAGITFRFVY